MGEYTSVLLTVEKIDIDEVVDFAHRQILESGSIEVSGDLCNLEFTEVRDGELDFLSELKEKSIPYSVYVDPLFNVHDGIEQHYRPEGDFECEFASDEIIVSVDELKQAANKGLDDVKDLIGIIEAKYHVPNWPCGRKTVVLGHESGVGGD